MIEWDWTGRQGTSSKVRSPPYSAGSVRDTQGPLRGPERPSSVPEPAPRKLRGDTLLAATRDAMVRRVYDENLIGSWRGPRTVPSDHATSPASVKRGMR